MAVTSNARCLVLGGGGVSGIAWEVGVLTGLAEIGVALGQAELYMGTSAGAVVASHLAAGVSAVDLFNAQIALLDTSLEQFRPYSQAAADAQNRRLVEKLCGDIGAARRRIGAFALRSETVPAAERRAIVASRLAGTSWPAQPLGVVAVDAKTGEGRVFSRDDPVDFIDAVAASCAVPGSWPVVKIGDASYMDGGIRSMTNADLATNFARVAVLAPLGFLDDNPVSGHLRAEIALLERSGSKMTVIVPDGPSVDAIGDNMLDPARRLVSAEAGRRQGRKLALTGKLVW